MRIVVALALALMLLLAALVAIQPNKQKQPTVTAADYVKTHNCGEPSHTEGRSNFNEHDGRVHTFPGFTSWYCEPGHVFVAIDDASAPEARSPKPAARERSEP